MGVLYLVEQNTVLRKSGERLVFCKKPPSSRKSSGLRQYDILMEWPCADVEHVMVFGNIQITTQAMQSLLSHGIEMALFSVHGSLFGQLTPPGAKNIILRQQQYQMHQDTEFVLDFSRIIVRHKILAAIKFLKVFDYNHPGTLKPNEIKDFENLLTSVGTIDSLDALRGYEGAASAKYFSLLGRLLPDEFKFSHRSRRPPKDPANAVLSFGYTIVASELQALLDGVGFDPYLGYYHQIHYGRTSLALDLLELFRHSLVDRLMTNLFNMKVLNKNDFQVVAKGGIYLSASGKKKFFGQYERMVGCYEGEVPNPKRKSGYRKLFQDQVNLLVKSITQNKSLEIVPELFQ